MSTSKISELRELGHDLNNALTAILGNAQLALEEVQPGSVVREDVQEIVKAARDARDMTRRMLEIVPAPGGK